MTSACIGRDDFGADVSLDLDTCVHLAVQGQTRAGKSSLAYVLLSSLATFSEPPTLVYGIDPGGVLLEPLNRWATRGPHSDRPGKALRVRPGHASRLTGSDANPQAAVQLLTTLVAQMARRIDWMRYNGVAAWPRDFNRVLIVLDEFPGLVAAAREHDRATRNSARTAEHLLALMGRLVREGAKAAVSVLVIAQRFDASLLGGDVRSNFPTRISFRMDNADGVKMLHAGATDDLTATITEFPQGRCYVETPGEPGRVVQVDRMNYAEYVDAVVYESARPVRARNAPVRAALGATHNAEAP